MKVYIKSLASDAQNSLNVAVRYFAHLNPLTIRKKGTRVKAYFALFMVCFFWGTTWLASRQGVQYMPALQLAGIRQTLGGLCYVSFFLAKKAAWPKGREWVHIIVLSFLNFLLSNGLSTWGVQYVSAGLGSVIGAIFPLWLVVIGWLGSRSRLRIKSATGLLLGFAGICVIFYERLHDFLDPSFRFGIYISLASTWSWAIGTLYTKKHALRFNPYFGLGLQMLISGASLMTIAHATHREVALLSIPWQSWAAIAYLVVFGSILSFVAYLYALQNLPTEQVALYAYVNPMVAVFLGWLLLNEPLTPSIVAGVLITLYGIYLVNRAIRRS